MDEKGDFNSLHAPNSYFEKECNQREQSFPWEPSPTPRGCLARVTSGATSAAVGRRSNSVNKLGKGWQQSSKQFVVQFCIKYQASRRQNG